MHISRYIWFHFYVKLVFTSIRAITAGPSPGLETACLHTPQRTFRDEQRVKNLWISCISMAEDTGKLRFEVRFANWRLGFVHFGTRV